MGVILPSISGVDTWIGCNLIAFACGLFAFVLGVLAVIPILKSSKRLLGQGRAVVGLILGSLVILIALFTVLVMPCDSRDQETYKAAGDVQALARVVENYQTEYGRYPGQDSTNNDHLYRGDEYRLLLAALRGSNLVWNGKPSNPRGVVFLSVNDRSIVTTNSGGTAQTGEMADPWGNRYEVVADWNGDNKIAAPLADGEAVPNRGVVVWSYGPKGKPVANPADKTHIRSWR